MRNNIPPITKNLIILNVLLYVSTWLLERSGINLYAYFAAYFPLSPYFKVYQIITHMFMHGGPTHILFNMFTLWMFGSVIEQTLGKKKYLILYFACGLGSFILYNFVNFLEARQMYNNVIASGASIDDIGYYVKNVYYESANYYAWLNSFPAGVQQDVKSLYNLLRTPMVGASGAIYGILVAFGMLYPNMQLMLLFPPIPIKAKILIPIMIIIEFYLGIKNYQGDSIAHFAHLGGAVIGFIFIYFWKKNRFKWN